MERTHKRSKWIFLIIAFVAISTLAISWTTGVYADEIRSPQNEEIPVSECTHLGTLKTTGKKAATCTREGYTGDTICENFGVVVEEGRVIAAKEHTPVTDKAVAATCTKDGRTKGSHCSVCKEVLEKQQIVKKTWAFVQQNLHCR